LLLLHELPKLYCNLSISILKLNYKWILNITKTTSYSQQPWSSEEKTSQRPTLKYFIISMIIAISIANVIVIFSEQHSKHSVSLWTLNIIAATLSTLCIIVIYTYGIHWLHGKSHLFLALGIISWFAADFTLLYNYYALSIKEQRLVTITNAL
jgi:sterol desaturase/sphingolipid hydroxylase (fatty acid hydroxylase superfamily)